MNLKPTPEFITVDPHHRLQIAQRIHQELLRELGQGIDVKQMLNSALYARDVLLVCQAYPGADLQRLGEQFRHASAQAIAQAAEGPRAWQHDSSGLGVSRPTSTAAHSDFDSLVDGLHDARPAARRWLTPSTWFSR